MTRSSPCTITASLCAAFAIAACGSATARTGEMATTPTAAATRSPTAGYPHTAADVHFMSGMIPHHAQAVLIAGWAAGHDASPSLRILCERIVVAQRDEIDLMRNWLRDRSEKVPEANATHMRMTMDGVEHDMLMPGMLSDNELAQLDRARGSEFDRLFLSFMIRHHEGAVTMVEELFGSFGAGQEETVFRLASDIFADQTTEIDRMQKMLAALDSAGAGRDR